MTSSWRATPAVPAEKLFPLIHLRRGEPFSRAATTESSERISALLGNEGYAFANVNNIPDINDETKEVAVTFFIDPGKRVYVRRVNMKGNTRTRDEVLRREMRQLETAWFSTELVKKSRERLKRLGYFEDVNIETPAVPGSADQVDVNVAVTEKPSRESHGGHRLLPVSGRHAQCQHHPEQLPGYRQAPGIRLQQQPGHPALSSVLRQPLLHRGRDQSRV